MIQSSDISAQEIPDDERPSNVLEHFIELEDILNMISNLQNVCENNFEKSYEKYSRIISKYQEQPHLLDPHLSKLITSILLIIHDEHSTDILIHCAFKYLYQLCKVRSYKVFVKFLPHELTDLEFALNYLEKQEQTNNENWETRYMLLLWMSILVLNPFHMSRLDAFSPITEDNPTNHVAALTKMERIFNLCKINCENNDTCSIVAAFLCAKYLVRTDVKDKYLPLFFDWVIEQNTSQTIYNKFGQLNAVAAILKHGKREDLIPHANNLLRWILSCDYKNSTEFLKCKVFLKIIQRLGLIYLKPRLAHWRYQRGSRSLSTNLVANNISQGNDKMEFENNPNMILDEEEDGDIVVPDEIEDIVEELLQALKSPSSDIRWLAAKGVGRVTNRLPKTLGDEVVGSVIELFNPLEPHEAWHGACLAIAELAKRGLLLPYRLTAMVPILLEALVYDEIKGYMSVGQHIRDSACYMSWAFARAYNPEDLQPFVEKISAGLLITTVFDREINCRRAASAAFQESVGRLGNFPHGIDILTEADFYTVGLRSNSYLHISDFIAKYHEYTCPLIDHLVEKKISHWDVVIRELTGKTLNKLTKHKPEYIIENVLPKLLKMTESINVNTRHGSIIAIGEIILALSELEKCNETNYKYNKYINNNIVNEISLLIIKFEKRDLFRGLSGEIMKQCCCNFIENASKAGIHVNRECIESWQNIIDKCIINKTLPIREAAVAALSCLCNAYYDHANYYELNNFILDKYIKGSDNDLEEHIRIGYVSAIGVLPKFIIQPKLNSVLNVLIKHSLMPRGGLNYLLNSNMNNNKNNLVNPADCANVENSITFNWSEARRDSIKSLSHVIQTIDFDLNDSESITNPAYLEKIFDCYLNALDEYTLDNRGDIGAWVREASMNALYVMLTSCPPELLKPQVIHEVMVKFAQQAVEKIDRTRGLAGKLFCSLVHHTPIIPHIEHHEKLKNIFPEDINNTLWLFADHTFPIFCSLLEYPEYSQHILLGLSASIGQLTESLIKYASSSFFNYLKMNPQCVERISNEITIIFSNNSLNERVTYPMLNFLDLLLSSGTLNNLLINEGMSFAEDIYRLVNIEIKGYKKLYKLVSSINVFCQLIQVPRLSNKVLSKMSLFLGLTHVHIRKTTATKLYEALTLYGDTCGIPDENLDEVLNILSETDWALPLEEVRPIRNELCTLMCIKAPVSLAVASSVKINH